MQSYLTIDKEKAETVLYLRWVYACGYAGILKFLSLLYYSTYLL